MGPLCLYSQLWLQNLNPDVWAVLVAPPLGKNTTCGGWCPMALSSQCFCPGPFQKLRGRPQSCWRCCCQGKRHAFMSGIELCSPVSIVTWVGVPGCLCPLFFCWLLVPSLAKWSKFFFACGGLLVFHVLGPKIIQNYQKSRFGAQGGKFLSFK